MIDVNQLEKCSAVTAMHSADVPASVFASHAGTTITTFSFIIIIIINLDMVE